MDSMKKTQVAKGKLGGKQGYGTDQFDNMKPEDRDQKMHTAKQKARAILQAQKNKTGFAILGKPPVEAIIDKKMPDNIKITLKR